MEMINFGAAEIVYWDEQYPEPAVEEHAVSPRVMLWRESSDFRWSLG